MTRLPSVTPEVDARVCKEELQIGVTYMRCTMTVSSWKSHLLNTIVAKFQGASIPEEGIGGKVKENFGLEAAHKLDEWSRDLIQY